MCGRFTQTATGEVLVERFGLTMPSDVGPRYNIAPGQPVLVILDPGDGPVARWATWGLRPAWGRHQAGAARLINARAETLDQKPAFRSLVARRRCLVIADGFYEWRKTPDGRWPVRFVRRDRAPFAFAGLWDEESSGAVPLSLACTVVTVPANDVVAPIHTRMPAILRPEDEGSWLDLSVPWEQAQHVLRPLAAEELVGYPVSRLVNSPTYDVPACIEPVEPAADPAVEGTPSRPAAPATSASSNPASAPPRQPTLF